MTSPQLVRLIRDAAVAKKARDVVAIDLRRKSSMADYFVICEGDTDRQTNAIAESVQEAAREKGLRPFHVSGERDGAWILLDYIDVIVHIFLPGERAFYDLEALWKAEPNGKVARRPAGGARAKTSAGAAGTRVRRKTA